MSDRTHRSPEAVTASRLFCYMLFFSRQTGPGPCAHEFAAASPQDVKMLSYLWEDQDSEHEACYDLSPEGQTKNSNRMRQDLQWCMQRHLIVEVNIWPCFHCFADEHGKLKILCTICCYPRMSHGRLSLSLSLCAGATKRHGAVPFVDATGSCKCTVSAPAARRQARSTGRPQEL